MRASPSSGDASHFLAFALGLSERHAEAEAQFIHTTTLLPRSPIVWFNLGNAQREHSSAERAKHSYRRALSLKPKWADAYINLGVAHGNARLVLYLSLTRENLWLVSLLLGHVPLCDIPPMMKKKSLAWNIPRRSKPFYA